MAKHILSVSYDSLLLQTRELLLCREGYSVTSALGFTAAIEHCKSDHFDLFVLGHSIPERDKKELIKVFRTNCPSPVLALRRHGEDEPEGADALVYPDDISGFLNEVDRILNSGPSPKRWWLE